MTEEQEIEAKKERIGDLMDRMDTLFCGERVEIIGHALISMSALLLHKVSHNDEEADEGVKAFITDLQNKVERLRDSTKKGLN